MVILKQVCVVPFVWFLLYVVGNLSLLNAPSSTITAYRHESTAYNSTLDYFSIKDDSTAWVMPILVRVSNDLRIVATQVICKPCPSLNARNFTS